MERTTKMRSRHTKFTQALVKAAAEARVNVHLEYRPDGTIIACIGAKTINVHADDLETELDVWMRKHHANPA
jgi:hypothetical protein